VRVAADLGVGTHPDSEIAFELPAHAREFTALVGLDASVGQGGCAVAKLYAHKVGGKPLWSSGLLRGGQEPLTVGPVRLAKAKRLILVTDSAHASRPADAYPFDIGDHVDWLVPMVAVEDPPPERAGLLRQFVPGWSAWSLSPADAARVNVQPQWDDTSERFVPALRFSGEPIELRRKLPAVSYANNVVELVLSPPESAVADRAALYADGERQKPLPREYAPGKYLTPQGPLRKIKDSHGKPLPYSRLHGPVQVAVRWDLQAFRGRPVELRLSLAPEQETKPQAVLWHRCVLKGTIQNLPPDGQPLVPDVPLSALTPVEAHSAAAGLAPTPDRVPAYGRSKPPISFHGQQFDSGYGMSRQSEVHFPVDPSYRQFVAVAGCCQDSLGPMEVLLDDEVAWSVDLLREEDPAVQIRVDVPQGTKTLTLRVGDRSTGPGRGAWANAGFLRQ